MFKIITLAAAASTHATTCGDVKTFYGTNTCCGEESKIVDASSLAGSAGKVIWTSLSIVGYTPRIVLEDTGAGINGYFDGTAGTIANTYCGTNSSTLSECFDEAHRMSNTTAFPVSSLLQTTVTAGTDTYGSYSQVNMHLVGSAGSVTDIDAATTNQAPTGSMFQITHFRHAIGRYRFYNSGQGSTQIEYVISNDVFANVGPASYLPAATQAYLTAKIAAATDVSNGKKISISSFSAPSGHGVPTPGGTYGWIFGNVAIFEKYAN